MENIQKIIAVISSIITLVITAVPFIIALVIKIKALIKEKDWQKTLSEIGDLVIEAEKITTLPGTEKKNYVLGKLEMFAIENKIVFDAKKAGEAIEKLIDVTKKVNINDKNILNIEQ